MVEPSFVVFKCRPEALPDLASQDVSFPFTDVVEVGLAVLYVGLT